MSNTQDIHNNDCESLTAYIDLQGAVVTGRAQQPRHVFCRVDSGQPKTECRHPSSQLVARHERADPGDQLLSEQADLLLQSELGAALPPVHRLAVQRLAVQALWRRTAGQV